MLVVVPILVVAAVLAAGVLVAVERWPGVDPGAPRLPGDRRVTPRARAAHLARRRLDPEAATGLALTGAALGLVILGAVGAMVQGRFGLAHYDLGAAEWAARQGTAAAGILQAVTALGATASAFFLAAVVLAVERRRVPLVPAALLLVVTIGGQWLVANGIKAVADRARPDIARLTDPFGSSFPSGHATTAAATFAVLALLLGRGRSRRVRAWLAAAAAGLAGAVATSRVLLGVHWVTDVVAGLALGWAWFALCSMAVGGRHLDLGQPLQR